MQSSPKKKRHVLGPTSNRLARFVSDIISPPLVYAVMGFIISWSSLPFLDGLIWGAFYGFFVSLVPVLFVLYLYGTGRVRDMHISNVRHRRIPYLLSMLGAIIVLMGVLKFGGPDLLLSLAVGSMIGLTLLWMINFFWLISSHMASICLASIFLMILFGIKTSIFTVPLVLLVFWSRLVLNRHTPLQLLAGMVVGIFSILILVITGLL